MDLILEWTRGMNIWSAVIYGVAAVFAVQALLALMTAHRKRSLRRFLDEESRRQPTEPAAAEKPRNKAA